MKRVDSHYYQLSDYERMLPDGSMDPRIPRFMSRAASEYLAYLLTDRAEAFRLSAKEQDTAEDMRRHAWIAEVKVRAAVFAITEASPKLQAEIDSYQNFGGEFFLSVAVCETEETA